MSTTADPATPAPATCKARFGEILPFKDGRHVVQIIAHDEIVGLLTADEAELRDQIKQAGDAVGVMTLFPAAGDGELQAVWECDGTRLAWMVRA